MFAAYPYGNESICFREQLGKTRKTDETTRALCGFLRQKHYITYFMRTRPHPPAHTRPQPVMLSLLRSESERQIWALDIKGSSLIKCTPRNPEYNSLTDSPTFTGARFMCVCWLSDTLHLCFLSLQT